MSRKLKPVPKPAAAPAPEPTLEQLKAAAFDAAQQTGMWTSWRDQLTAMVRQREGNPELRRLEPPSSS